MATASHHGDRPVTKLLFLLFIAVALGGLAGCHVHSHLHYHGPTAAPAVEVEIAESTEPPTPGLVVDLGDVN